MQEAAAIIATIILIGLSIFQLLLIFGVPIGKFAWGGSHTVLPTQLRLASVLSIILYVLFAVVVLNRAGVLNSFESSSWINVATWILTGYFILGILMNAISRSKPERLVMTPVASVLALLFLYVALA